MSGVMGSSGAYILAGLYLIIMIESATTGLLVKYAASAYLKYSRTKLSDRDTNSVLLLTFVVIAVIGHLLTVPCLCYGAQKHRAAPLIPYLVWRMLLSIQTVILVVWQSNVESSRLDPATFYDVILPVGMTEALVGIVFFAIAIRAHREFHTQRLLAVERYRASMQNEYGHYS